MTPEEFNNNYKLALKHGSWTTIPIIVWVLLFSGSVRFIGTNKFAGICFITACLLICPLLIILLHFRNKRAEKFDLYCPNCNFNYLSLDGHKRINDLLATGKCVKCNNKFLNHLEE